MSLQCISFQTFLNTHPATASVQRCTPEQIELYRPYLSEDILRFWQEVGRGAFSNGLIHVINPTDMEDSLAMWLGQQRSDRVPIARSAFGDIFITEIWEKRVDHWESSKR